jgi:hypothetical protein
MLLRTQELHAGTSKEVMLYHLLVATLSVKKMRIMALYHNGKHYAPLGACSPHPQS